jgi:preprotein translocase subunit SecA
MKDTWIKKAICAKFFLKEKQDYVIENNQIRIVDYQNTGVI